jgi:tripartite ATP-independent transporter DctM subunit
VGRIRGGLAHASILSCMFFGGITGSAVADASAIGTIMIPAMRTQYSNPFACAIISAAGIMGPIIPPSIPMVLYAIAASSVSIAALFAAGIVPGVLMTLGCMIVAYITARQNNWTALSGEKLAARIVVRRTLNALLPLLMPLIIVGGILLGIFTPTEAAAVSVAYALVIGLFVTQELKIAQLPSILINTGMTTSVVLLMVATANIASWLLTTQQVPALASAFMQSLTTNPYVFLLLVNIFLLLVGCVLDTAGAIIMLVPILAPLAEAYHIHPLHFALIFVVNLVIGMITPPVGVVLFVVSGIGKIRIETLARAVLPFLLAEVGILLVLTYLPAVTMFVPRMMGLIR